MIAVIAHERGQIESDREPTASMLEQVLVTLVSLFRRGEAGELAHRPEPAAIAGRVNAARVRRLAGITEVLLVAPITRQVGFGVEPPNRHAADGSEPRLAGFIQIHAGSRADGPLGSFRQRRSQ